MQTDPFYVDLLARHGLKYFAAAMVSPDRRVEVALSIQRKVEKPEYSNTELNMLARLGRHVEQSLRLGIRLMDSELSKTGLGAALARVKIGVFILDSMGRVVFLNPTAQSLVGDGLVIVNDRLIVKRSMAHPRNVGKMDRLVSQGFEDLLAEPRPVLIHRRSSERPLALYMLPIPMAATVMNAFLTHARMIVLALDPDNGSPVDPSLIRDVLGLTLGEAKIASLVGSGLPPREAAEKLGIAEGTARTVLKRVFSKAGVTRQSELTALLTRLVLK
jgi:DNA-binding CsgD family transcriptional regulator